MSFGALLPLLPFYYPQSLSDQNIAMLSKLREICSGNLNRAIYLIEKAFPDIFQGNSFKMFYEEHQRIYNLSLDESDRTSLQVDENKLFANVAQSVFETKTGKKAKDNREAFRMLLSLLRRKDNWEKSRG
jgi:hypothetical protein